MGKGAKEITVGDRWEEEGKGEGSGGEEDRSVVVFFKYFK
jgi:hypothetical protein